MIIPLMKNILTCRTCQLRYYLVVLSFIFVIGNIYILKNLYKPPQSEPVIKTQREVTTNFEKRTPDKYFSRQHVRDINFAKLQENTKKPELQQEIIKEKIYPFKIGVLVIACNRPAVSRCLDKIFQYKPSHIDIPVTVSQDCKGEESTAKVINQYNVTHIVQPNSDQPNVEPGHNQFIGYYKIARHYKFAVDKVFEIHPNLDSVIILEDDLEIAPDFFDYFLATRSLLVKDETIMCVSAWNDIGKASLIDTSAIDKLYRSDFFPGLGWMLTKKFWLNELSSNWPKGFWDDWLRRKDVRKERVCIRPEISRTKTFGKIGVSMGQFFDAHLKHIVLNSEPFSFQDYDLDYLIKEYYDRQFIEEVYGAKEHSINDVNNRINSEVIRITYSSKEELDMLCRRFEILVDRKDGVPRTAYRGIISFFRNDKRVYLAPKKGWKEYY